jgi:hypothetical protein
MLRYPAPRNTVMVVSHVAAQKFLLCNSRTVLPFCVPGTRSMYAMDMF